MGYSDHCWTRFCATCHSCCTCVEDTLSGTLVGHSIGTLLCGTLVAHSCRALAGGSCWTSLYATLVEQLWTLLSHTSLTSLIIPLTSNTLPSHTHVSHFLMARPCKHPTEVAANRMAQRIADIILLHRLPQTTQQDCIWIL